jgi:hypothetical protein
MAVVDLSIFSALDIKPLKRNTEEGGPDGAVSVEFHFTEGQHSVLGFQTLDYTMFIPRSKVVDVILALQRAKEEAL